MRKFIQPASTEIFPHLNIYCQEAFKQEQIKSIGGLLDEKVSGKCELPHAHWHTLAHPTISFRNKPQAALLDLPLCSSEVFVKFRSLLYDLYKYGK